jgi:hypothetical protein
LALLAVSNSYREGRREIGSTAIGDRPTQPQYQTTYYELKNADRPFAGKNAKELPRRTWRIRR